ncbi:MAG: type II toxin-antitoxin system RelE/ParE family toxin [Pseudomonadota bacterium]|nr:type II toxin-antitoxin system RelE/ParE family toxin [Pseudomonadota bacterium]
MRIVWTNDAVANVEAIVTYIATFNPAAADHIVERLIAFWPDVDHSGEAVE